MNECVFSLQIPNINHAFLRVPQYEAYDSVKEYYTDNSNRENREVGIVLPVGCGKSGLITLLPFAIKSRRTLVVAPNVKIADQLFSDFDMSNPQMFYLKCSILDSDPFPEAVEIRGTTVNRDDLNNADVVITNIQQLQGDNNRWLSSLEADFFDLIIFDEAHHNVASSWENLREKFTDAKIVNLSATPMRADGQRMSGEILYTYPVCDAIKKGYVKKLKAIVLNPATLKYVREEDGQEIEVALEEVRRLGEEDADFRKSIVTSKETLDTIVDASIRELYKIRNATNSSKHKIIASALNYKHCIQIKNAYVARGLKADYIHSREDSASNDRVMEKLNNNELDVIVQVRKLGEGFDHPYLSVAAVFSIFKNLSPFVQFVGRIMRVIEQNNPKSVQNQGTVVFHAGANIAQRWEDFQEFSQADQEFFEELLPLEELDFADANEISIVPEEGYNPRSPNQVKILGQNNITVEEIPLLEDEEVRKAFELLLDKNFYPDIYKTAFEQHKPIRVSKVRQRQSDRKKLDELVKNATGAILKSEGVNPQGKKLDIQHLGKTNFIVIKSAFDKKIADLTGTDIVSRSEMKQEQIDCAIDSLDRLTKEIREEYFHG